MTGEDQTLESCGNANYANQPDGSEDTIIRRLIINMAAMSKANGFVAALSATAKD
jgi:hypothetical protein